ncbi:hypothetical protein [Gimesia fumaroli]|uniref:hypothetical protein n=1 Tax=Gimesia fumaroli TaxID=2527976 RepID=UPI0011AADABD|nr:hypothetical protein [Gimesia fumaroli]
MSVFHHKAILLKQDEPNYWFQFFPDFVGNDTLWGEFCFNINDGSFEITHTVDHPQAERSVFALIHKIRKTHKTSHTIPDEVYFIA